MSLINDALKRAKKSQQSDPPSGAPPLPPMEPEEPHNGSGWVFITIVVVLVVAAGFFIGLAFTKRKPLTEVATTTPIAQNTQVVAVVSAPVPPPVPQTNVVVAAPKPPEPPALKLQGIFFNAARPQAIVNGTTVYVGDLVNGFRVKLIAQNSVSFITPDGTEKTLALAK
jgi:hypothetical protein